jgi:hypothetical protein
MMRHVAATLWRAANPGDSATVAAVLHGHFRSPDPTP